MIKDFIEEASKAGIDITENTCEYCDRDDVYGWKTASKWKKEDERLNPKENKTMSQDKKSNYYDTGNIETIEIIKAKLTHEQYIGYLLGNVIKYACRLNFKGSKSRDFEKLANYSKWLETDINNSDWPDISDFDYRLDAEKEKHE